MSPDRTWCRATAAGRLRPRGCQRREAGRAAEHKDRVGTSLYTAMPGPDEGADFWCAAGAGYRLSWRWSLYFLMIFTRRWA
jgi:hypothetical protein